ncbi:sulfatase [Candidatus Omnitrophota bacterium]
MFLDTKGYFSLIRLSIPLFVEYSILIGLAGLLCFQSVYALFKLIETSKRKTTKTRFKSFSKTIILLIIIQTAVGAIIFSWELIELVWTNRQEMSKSVTSNTDKDMNVIIVLVDALRVDHLGCYGYKRPTSPFIDTFARSGTLFKNCYAQCSWTAPSVASLFTSLYPSLHGVTTSEYMLPDQVITIAEALRREGYVTYCYLSNPSITRLKNYNQGFDYFDDYLMKDRMLYAVSRNLPIFKYVINTIPGLRFQWQDRDSAQIANKRIFSWLDRHKDDNFFMYLHYMEPHDPYSPPYPYNAMFPYVLGNEVTRLIASYDGEIRFFDDKFKELIWKLKSLGIYDKTLIILTSDHGEGFYEHGAGGHGHTIYEYELKVPFIIKHKDYIPEWKEVIMPVRLIDIMPTVLDILDIDYEVAINGRSLYPLLKTPKSDMETKDIYVELVSGVSNEYVIKGLIKGDWKYILTESSGLRDVQKLGHDELYNLKYDPRESHNLIDRFPDVLTNIRKEFNRYKEYCSDNAIIPPKVEIDFESVEALRSLGYLQ